MKDNGNYLASAYDQLTPKKQKAITALILCPTIKQAAESSGVPANTIYKWRQRDPSFMSAYREARLSQLHQAQNMLLQAANKAVLALVAILDDVKSDVFAKVKSAQTILEYGFRTYEQDRVESRLDSLEQLLEQVGDGTPKKPAPLDVDLLNKTLEEIEY